MAKKLKAIGGWVGSAVVLGLAVVGIGLIGGFKSFAPSGFEPKEDLK